MSQVQQVMSQVTDAIVKMLESGDIGQWRKLWRTTAAMMQRNAVTHRPYTGYNQMLFAFVAAEKGYKSSQWMPVSRVAEYGLKVKEGEFPHIGIKKFVGSKTVEGFEFDGAEIKETNKKIGFAGYKAFEVYNLDQLENRYGGQLPSSLTKHEIVPADDRRDFTANEIADQIIENCGIEIRHGGNQAYYSPNGNYVQMPERNQFVSCAAYYSVVMHELAHATGHETRLNRKIKNNFGTEDYAFEELIAEISSTMIMSWCGIETADNLDENHISYLASWLKKLKDDPRCIVKAANFSGIVVNYLLGMDDTE